MKKLDAEELELLEAFNKGELKSVASKSELARLKAAARATATKDKRVNIRLSSVDLSDLQARALQEGLPYQTLIASIVHKYVTGRLTDRVDAPPSGTPRSPARRPLRAD
jgi:predicted DNA binding CopG/RHH family protein